jgi:hypothetical protein
MDAKVRGGTTGSCPANDLISLSKRDGRAGGTGERLSLLGNDADARFKVEFPRVEIYVARARSLRQCHGPRLTKPHVVTACRKGRSEFRFVRMTKPIVLNLG